MASPEPPGTPRARGGCGCPWTRWRLTTKVGVLLALSVAVPLAVAETFTWRLARRVTEERTAAILASRAEQLANELDALNGLYLAAVRRIAWTPLAKAVLAGGTPRERHELRGLLVGLADSDDSVVAAHLVDARGRVVFSSMPASEGLDLSFRPFVARALRGETVIGERGLAVVRAERPALVLCDLAMPGLDGLAVARTLRADPQTAEIPLVALTAHAMVGDEERAYAAGFEAYLTKPLDRAALDPALAAAGRRRARDAAA